MGIESGFTYGNFEDYPRVGGLTTDTIGESVARWVERAGFIFSRRNEDQSLQSNYINSTLLKEIIENNKVTTLMQNRCRFRSGKLHQRNEADMSIKWLLDAYTNLVGLKKDVVIVPVMLCYDRVYEQNNIAEEMITAQKKLYNANYGLFGTIKNALFTPENNFGDIYVKHLEPINLSNYLSEKIGQSLVTQENFESAALKLSQELMLIQ